MIIRAVYIGNSEEAYINKEFKEGLNIISSDDNNKGKTKMYLSVEDNEYMYYYSVEFVK